MKKGIKAILLNSMIFLFALVGAGFVAELIYSKLVSPNETGSEKWICGNNTKSLVRGFEPNCKGRWVKQNGSESFDIEFSTDAFGRRTVFDKVKKTASDAGQILFFGGSDVLGMGVDDRDTVANQFLSLSDFATVRNYGGAGVGPQHVLELLQQSDFVREAPPDANRNVIVFFFADHHVERVVGSWSIATAWGADFPYYALDANDQLILKGTFLSGGRYSPLQLLAKKSLLLDNVISKASSYLSFSDANIRLTAKMMAAIKSEFASRYKNARFYVLLNPITAKSAPKLKKFLTEFGVDFLDYSKVWDPQDPANRLPEGHPSALVYKSVAQQLARDLKN